MEDFLLNLGDWLLNQAGVAVVMGVVIYFQQKEKKEYRAENKELQEKINKVVAEQAQTLSDISSLLDKNADGMSKLETTVVSTKDTVLGKTDELKNYIINGKIGN